MMEPPDLQTIRSMLRIARIVAIVFGIIFLIVFLGTLAAAVLIAGVILGALFFPILFVVWFVVDLLIYIEIGHIMTMLDARQYVQAKEKTLIWMILGFILAGVIVGVLMLIAYLKFDAVINWQRGTMAPGPVPTGWPGAPTMAPAPPVPPAPVPAPTSSGVGPAAGSAATTGGAPPTPGMPVAAPICPRCGRPGTWVAQYSRWYCYTDSMYL